MALAVPASAEFLLRDGDTVAFLGDSITAARGYTKVVEHYTLMRFPERRVRFINAGKGGDTASGSLKRLEEDVFSKGATVVTVAFGINDIAWGAKADAAHRQSYLDGIRSIIEQCQARRIRPIICSPSITSEAPDAAEAGFLQSMADEGQALAKSLGAQTIDLQRGMREVQRKVLASNAKEKDESRRTRLHLKDGIHLEDLGQIAMAQAMLVGLGAPEDVSNVEIDAAAGTLVSAAGCAIADIEILPEGISFTRLDEGLPLNLGPFSGFSYRWVPLGETLNRYLLTVKNLPPGRYEIRAEERVLGQPTAGELARGVNISSMTANGFEPGGPWDVQSNVVKELVDARDKLWYAGVQETHYLPRHPLGATLEKQVRALDDELVSLQRAAAKPYRYHFEIRKAVVAEK